MTDALLLDDKRPTSHRIRGQRGPGQEPPPSRIWDRGKRRHAMPPGPPVWVRARRQLVAGWRQVQLLRYALELAFWTVHAALMTGRPQREPRRPIWSSLKQLEADVDPLLLLALAALLLLVGVRSA
jgi:hypothetical protein